jgi:hypothetical protein
MTTENYAMSKVYREPTSKAPISCPVLAGDAAESKTHILSKFLAGNDSKMLDA